MGDLGATDITWTEEAYEDFPVPNPVELIKAASLLFDINFDEVVTRGSGPDTPDAAPYDYGEAETVIVDLQKVSLTKEL